MICKVFVFVKYINNIGNVQQGDARCAEAVLLIIHEVELAVVLLCPIFKIKLVS